MGGFVSCLGNRHGDVLRGRVESLDSGSESLDLTPVTGDSGGNSGARGGTPFRRRLREVIRGPAMTAGEFVTAILCLPSSRNFFRDRSCVHSLEAGDLYLEPWVTALFTP